MKAITLERAIELHDLGSPEENDFSRWIKENGIDKLYIVDMWPMNESLTQWWCRKWATDQNGRPLQAPKVKHVLDTTPGKTDWLIDTESEPFS